MYKSKITGMGMYVPENEITNRDLTALMDTSHEWILERTGIESRRHIKKGDGNTTATMGVKASQIAIERSGIDKNDIDLILFATLSPDYYFPGSGVIVQKELDIPTCPAMDIRNQCSGFIYALSTADQFIKTGMYKNILIIGSENHSGGLDMTTRGRGVSVIFGDGAGAVVLSRSSSEETGILSTHLHSEGKYAEELSLIGPSTRRWVPEIMAANDAEDTSYYPYMNGQLVFKNAVVRFSEVIMEGLQENQMTPDQIDMLIPHQANLRISQFIQKKFGLTDDQVYNNIMRYGNTTAGSIPIAMTEAWEAGKIKSGDLVVLAAFGSGFTWGSALIRW
ncbi:MAG: 3-oxoacyl-[acyl-carrier-protein] synthase 3 [Flavobacteriaceae bacterium]|nr:MAG: 3-oxoacyl-[acyl-carrier-protein] synthase 3 [Flavobacteriaceae bacterium]|tara:strand:- start:1119 stop:2126 length:1008 start_codon:yes stop_codon:yes gene_type:complete